MLNNGRVGGRGPQPGLGQVVRGGGGASGEDEGVSADYLLGWMTMAGLRGLVDALLGGCVLGWGW